MKSIPAEWVIAQAAMRSFNPPLLLHSMDQSFLTDGEVSISHVLNMASEHHPQISRSIDGNTLRSLRSKGILDIKDIGIWTIRENGYIQLSINHSSFGRSWSTSAQNNWEKIARAFDIIRIEQIIRGPTDLALEQARRKRKAEALLHALVSVVKFPSS